MTIQLLSLNTCSDFERFGTVIAYSNNLDVNKPGWSKELFEEKIFATIMTPPSDLVLIFWPCFGLK
jgi:hypothetical protein